MGKKQQIAKRKQELTAALAKNRVIIDMGRTELKQKLSVKHLLRKLVTSKPKALFASCLGAGLVTTLLLRRPKVVTKEKAKDKSTVLLSWALTLAKPAVKAWLINRAKLLAVRQLESRKRTTDTRI